MHRPSLPHGILAHPGLLILFAIAGTAGILPARRPLAAEPAAARTDAGGARLLAGNVRYDADRAAGEAPRTPAPPADAADSVRTLDVYGPEAVAGAARPVVLYVHGGGWRHGDKAWVGVKPAAFVERGYLFASVAYRLREPVTPREQAGDVARAVGWLHAHAAEYGGDPDTIFLVGHSAGAHLAALVATDERLLGGSGLDLGAVAGVVLLDGAGYDVPRQMAQARLPAVQALYRTAFGDDPEAQREASPIAHVAAGKRMPPFLLFHVGMRPDSRAQAQALAEGIRAAGGRATTVHEPGKNHLTINRELGLPGDGPTARLFAFLDEVRTERRAGSPAGATDVP